MRKRQQKKVENTIYRKSVALSFKPGDMVRVGNEVREIREIHGVSCAVRDGYYSTLEEYLRFAAHCGFIAERVGGLSENAN